MYLQMCQDQLIRIFGFLVLLTDNDFFRIRIQKSAAYSIILNKIRFSFFNAIHDWVLKHWAELRVVAPIRVDTSVLLLQYCCANKSLKTNSLFIISV